MEDLETIQISKINPKTTKKSTLHNKYRVPNIRDQEKFLAQIKNSTEKLKQIWVNSIVNKDTDKDMILRL